VNASAEDEQSGLGGEFAEYPGSDADNPPRANM
jgi:hypothetical protein